MKDKESVVIWGAGGHARVVAFILRAAGREVACFLDTTIEHGGEVHSASGLVLTGHDAPVRALNRFGSVISIAVGNNHARIALAGQAVELGYSMINTLHPYAVIAPDAIIGQGIVVAAGSVIHPQAFLGDLSIVNTGATIDHDCSIGRAAHIAPGAHLAGWVKVGDASMIAVGACVADRIEIGKNSIVGAGSVVVRNIPDDVIAFGNPCRVIRDNKQAQ